MQSEPILNLPKATKILCLTNLVAFVLSYYVLAAILGGGYVNILYSMAIVPSRYFVGDVGIEAAYSVITHMFLHGGFMHFAINIGMLMALGSAIENSWGAKRFLLFYFLSGLIAIIPHILIYRDSLSPLIGASGAISGLFAAIIIMIHKREHHVTVFGRNRGLVIAIFAFVFVTIVFGLAGMPGIEAEIAWVVHLGGFLGGMLLYKFIDNTTDY